MSQYETLGIWEAQDPKAGQPRNNCFTSSRPKGADYYKLASLEAAKPVRNYDPLTFKPITHMNYQHRQKENYVLFFLENGSPPKNSSPLKTGQSTNLQMKNNVYVPSSLSQAQPPKQHIKDNVNGDGSETDMIMQLLQHNTS